MKSRIISIRAGCDQTRYFKPKHDLALNTTKWFLCLNLTVCKHSVEQKLKWKTEPKEK